jgi:dual-specificity kinase
MSTPSTALASHHTLPPHQQYYSHHQVYQPNSINGQMTNGSSRLPNTLYNGYPTTASTSELRRTATANSRQSQTQIPPVSTNQHSDSPPSKMARRQPPNWGEFYKNGVPREVIVIDDDSPEPASKSTQVANGSTKHTDKRRKTAASTTYDPVYHQQTSYSSTQTPAYQNASNNTGSTDRTASAIGTTAPTSLGSNGSRNAYVAPPEEAVTGQKRKRAAKPAAKEEKEPKRREIDLNADPFELYKPPPNPPIKAKDVFVQQIADVRASYLKYGLC